jgi:hypothetical protein
MTISAIFSEIVAGQVPTEQVDERILGSSSPYAPLRSAMELRLLPSPISGIVDVSCGGEKWADRCRLRDQGAGGTSHERRRRSPWKRNRHRLAAHVAWLRGVFTLHR